MDFFRWGMLESRVKVVKSDTLNSLTIETASLWAVGVEETERNDDDQKETGNHDSYDSGHGNRFY